MTQDEPLDAVIRARIRGLRVARGWSLDALAGRCHMSASTLSRIETGHRRISIDQLVPIARALGTSLDQLVEPVDDDDVVIRPRRDRGHGAVSWMLTREDEPHGLAVAKMRITARRPTHELRRAPRPRVVHGAVRHRPAATGGAGDPGRGRAGGAVLDHGPATRSPRPTGQVEIIVIFDRDGRRAHLDAIDLSAGG